MIIRILGEGQFRLDDSQVGKVNKIDNQIVDHVQKGNKAEFLRDLARLISTVKELGEPLDPVEIMPSDIIIPPRDLSLEEARKVFCDISNRNGVACAFPIPAQIRMSVGGFWSRSGIRRSHVRHGQWIVLCDCRTGQGPYCKRYKKNVSHGSSY